MSGQSSKAVGWVPHIDQHDVFLHRKHNTVNAINMYLQAKKLVNGACRRPLSILCRRDNMRIMLTVRPLLFKK